MSGLLGRGVPAYLLLALFYVGFVMVIAIPILISGGGEDATTISQSEGAVEGGATAEGAAVEAVSTTQQITDAVEAAMQLTVRVPFLSGVDFPVSWTTFFIICGFLCAWVEALRATNIKISGNDFMSLIVTVVSLVLFVGVPWFSTTAFMIVPLVGFGDLILDRYIGQAVARRDFGGLVGGGE